MPPQQAEFFQDNQITFEEYRQSVLSVRSCVSETGLFSDVGEIEQDGFGQLSFYVEYQAPEDAGANETEAWDNAYESCNSEYGDHTASAYVVLNAPSVEEQEALRPQLVTCLQTAGVNIETDASRDDIRDAFTSLATGSESVKQSAQECGAQFPRFFLEMPAKK
ncbi:hypothetical protein [Demequina sp.]|uniref:hypothetical protein n=1 Tax=Demequina sp. TaxID=2050685 RepID=UPI003A8A0F28